MTTERTCTNKTLMTPVDKDKDVDVHRHTRHVIVFMTGCVGFVI